MLLRRRVSGGLLGYDMSRTHSIMRIATTASPVSGAEVCARSKAIAIAVRKAVSRPHDFNSPSSLLHHTSTPLSRLPRLPRLPCLPASSATHITSTITCILLLPTPLPECSKIHSETRAKLGRQIAPIGTGRRFVPFYQVDSRPLPKLNKTFRYCEAPLPAYECGSNVIRDAHNIQPPGLMKTASSDT